MPVRWLLTLLAFGIAAHGADPQELWNAVLNAKGGSERLRSVHTLAVYMRPAPIRLAGPPANWLFVLPQRYFEWNGMPGEQLSMVVDATADRVAIDATGMPRKTRQLSPHDREQLTLNQLVFLLETAWLQPTPVAVKHRVLIVQAGGRTFELSLNKSDLPEKIYSPPNTGPEEPVKYSYHLERYADFRGIMLPTRVTQIMRTREWTWDVDYEIDAKYNPKLFERMPDLADGPEPWRRP
jgi:hypothetical protein